MADVQLSTLGGVIKTAYEGQTNTNAFTDAEQTKLSGIETAATADQTGAEIKAAYEGEADTNAFTDAEQTKVGYLDVTAATDLDVVRITSDDVQEWRTQDPDDFLRIADQETRVDSRTGDKDAVRLSYPSTTKIFWPQNPDYLPPVNLGAVDEWPGYAPGTLIVKSLTSASENLLAIDAGKVLVASGSATTLNIQLEATESIVHSTGHYVSWIVQNNTGGDYTIQAPVGVSLNGTDNGSVVIADDNRAALVWTADDTFEVWV